LAALSLAMLMASLGTSIANVALPTLVDAFGASFQEVQWVVLAYLLAITTLIVSVGRLGDLAGRRKLLLAGIVLFTAASVLCGVAPTLLTLTAARVAQGLGAAILMALSLAFIAETVPKGRIGSAMGLLGTMSAIGTALGPSLGGLLISALGWRAIFLINVPLGFLALLLALRHLPADRRVPGADRAGFDNVGTGLLALTLAAYTLAVTIGGGSFGALNAALLLGAGLGVALFAFAETRSSSPLVRLGMLRSDPLLSAGLGMSGLVSTVMMATLVVGPFYLSSALGLGAAAVGLVMTIGPAVAALTGVPAGRVADRVGTHRMVVVGLLAMFAGALALAAIPASGVLGYMAPIVVVTAGYAMFQTANNAMVMGDVGPEQRGLVSGMLNLSRNLGLITGASVMGAIFALASGAGDIDVAQPGAVATGMRITFLVAAGLIALALAAALLSRAAGGRIQKGIRFA
jgi:EmrB/QacA subfamily drug resistance transporter